MTATAATPDSGPSSRSSRRPLVIGIAIAVALVLVALVAGKGSNANDPLSPTSTSSDGLKGLVLLLQSFDARVETGARVPDADVRVALLARDGLDAASRDQLRTWVDGGGTLVVTDPHSPLSAPSSGSVAGFDLVRGHCDLDGVAGANRLQIGGLDSGDLSFLGGVTLDVEGNSSCFGDGSTAYVVETPIGAGTIVSVGAPNPFANAFLAKADDSVLAMRLLQPGGSQPVAILESISAGSGRTTLLDLVSDRVFQAVIQLGIAFLIYALWRARRLGRPVLEPQPVAIAGSQLVQAVGALEQRTHATQRAANALRHDVGRLVRERYGLAPTTPVATVAGVVAERTGLDPSRVTAALSDTPVTDDGALLALSNDLDTIRKEILHGR